MDAINIATIISVALFGSFGHCLGMCGGFVVAYSSTKIDEKSPNKFLYHLIYNLGRVSSYAIMGALFGYVGSFVAFSVTAQGYLYFFIGMLMVLMGLSFLGKINFLLFTESSFITKPFFKKKYSWLLKSKTFSSFYFLGALNGFIPCGLVYFFLASAAVSASPFWGIVIMVVFGLSTMPAMIGFGFLVNFLVKGDIRAIMIKIAGIIVILYGIYIMYTGYVAILQ